VKERLEAGWTDDRFSGAGSQTVELGRRRHEPIDRDTISPLSRVCRYSPGVAVVREPSSSGSTELLLASGKTLTMLSPCSRQLESVPSNCSGLRGCSRDQPCLRQSCPVGRIAFRHGLVESGTGRFRKPTLRLGPKSRLENRPCHQGKTF
jgi:hypothetical protein